MNTEHDYYKEQEQEHDALQDQITEYNENEGLCVFNCGKVLDEHDNENSCKRCE